MYIIRTESFEEVYLKERAIWFIKGNDVVRAVYFKSKEKAKEEFFRVCKLIGEEEFIPFKDIVSVLFFELQFERFWAES